MSDQQPQGPQVDVGVVIKKLQDKLSEAMTTIIVQEAQLEALMAEKHDHNGPGIEVTPEPNL